MPPRTYSTLEGGTGAWSLTITLPDLAAATAAIPAALLTVGGSTAWRITREAQAAFPYEPMADRFEPFVVVAPDLVRAGTLNDDPILPFVEWDTAPHWPPHGPDSSLARWAERHSISAWYVAKLISERGTLGRHAMQVVLQAAADQFEADLTAAITAVLDA